MTDKKSPSAIVLPFGKNKGSTVAELLTKDPAYAEWVANQGWVAERFAELHAAILSRGAVTDDSPEHNAIQVRFLDETFRLACLMAAEPSKLRQDKIDVLSFVTGIANKKIKECSDAILYAGEKIENGPEKWEKTARDFSEDKWFDKYNSQIAESRKSIAEANLWLQKPCDFGPIIKTMVKFEFRGIDVLISWSWEFAGRVWANKAERAIEIKPTMGDDFPSVMRQMGRLKSDVLVVGEYTGRAVSEPQLRQMFEANGHTLLFVRDIEAEIANARAELA